MIIIRLFLVLFLFAAPAIAEDGMSKTGAAISGSMGATAGKIESTTTEGAPAEDGNNIFKKEPKTAKGWRRADPPFERKAHDAPAK